jgi:DNA-binding Xre family transcriptional regulator
MGNWSLIMEISYKPLWKLLIDRDITKSELRLRAGISTRALAKLGKNEDVSTDVLRKICTALNCDLSDIMETKSGAGQMEGAGL